MSVCEFCEGSFRCTLLSNFCRTGLDNTDMNNSQETHPNLDVPKIVPTLIKALVDLGGLVEEGIFRLSVDKTSLNNLKEQFELGNYNIPTINPHVPACLLKDWLVNLPEAIIPEVLPFFYLILRTLLHAELMYMVLNACTGYVFSRHQLCGRYRQNQKPGGLKCSQNPHRGNICRYGAHKAANRYLLGCSGSTDCTS